MEEVTCSIVLFNNNQQAIMPLISLLLECDIIAKIFLIDNSATNVLQGLVVDKRIKYIFNSKNVGFGAGHNIALKQVLKTSKYHIILNADIYFKTGSIEHIHIYMQQNADVAHLMPKIKYPNGNLQYACNLLPAPIDLFGRRFLSKLLIKRLNRFEMRQSGYNKIMQVPYMVGCFMFLRIEALNNVGLFDERFFLYPEDIDLTRRIHKFYKTIFYPYATVTHVHERGSRKSIKLLIIHIVNTIRYFNKWGWIFDKERSIINKKIEAQYI